MAKRSKKRPPDLRSVSRQTPTREEAAALLEAMFRGPPIVAAILGQSVLENELEELLRAKFTRRDDATWGSVTGESGPLATFNTKIIAAYAFNLIDDVTRKNLNVIRDIRNAFAHSKCPLDFANASVIERLTQVAVPASTKSRRAKRLRVARSAKDGRQAFLLLVDQVGVELLKRQTERLKQRSKYLRRKVLSRVPGLGHRFRPTPPNALASFLLNQTDDPKALTPPVGLLGDWLTSQSASKTGK